MTFMALSITLLIASATDLQRREIPNWLVVVAGLAGLTLAAAEGGVASAALSGLFAAAPFLTAALIKPEGMGMGDVKLVAVLGVYLGSGVWFALAVALGLAGLTGVMLSLGQRVPPSRMSLPLAPFLALGVGTVLAISAGPLQ